MKTTDFLKSWKTKFKYLTLANEYFVSKIHSISKSGTCILITWYLLQMDHRAVARGGVGGPPPINYGEMERKM